MSRKCQIVSKSCIAALLVATPAFAVTRTWNGSQGNDNWTNSLNWTPAGVPNDGTADVIFAGTTRPDPDMNANWNINSLTFNNTAGQFFLISSTNSVLTLGAGGITNNSAFNPNINYGINLSAPQTWNAASGGIGAVAVNNGGNLLTIDGANSTNFNGTVSGSGGLTKNGLGTLHLPMANYSGTTTVNAGSLIFDGTSNTSISGALNIGDSVGTSIDTVLSNVNNRIADTATVSIFSTGAWDMNGQQIGPTSETITNLNVTSTGIAGGAVVTVGATLTILGNVNMTGGTFAISDGSSKMLLNGGITTNAATVAAAINCNLDLNGAARTLTVGDGAVATDLDISGVVTNGALTKSGLGTLRLSAPNTYAGGTTLNAGTILIGNNSALGTGPLTANGGTLRADGAARTIANVLNGSFAVDGAFDLTLNAPVNIPGNIIKNGLATLIFAQSATAGGLTVNAGAARFDVPFTFSTGLVNSASVLFGTQTLTINGAGLENEGSLPLAGGTLAGSGPVVNGGFISGTGTIDGTGGFTNNGQLTPSGGNITLAKSGATSNAGNIEVPSGLQLRLTGGTLANTGTIDLEGGTVAGTATLNNNPGGIISGHGTISSPFSNNAGSLVSEFGALNVPQAFANTGEIVMGGGSATLGGAGTITNTGLIRGDGKVSKTVINNAGGELRAEPGKSLILTGSGNINSGAINLYGGLLELTQGFTNNASGFISGNGTFVVGNGLTNNGTMNFSGLANVVGSVTNSAGAKIISSGGGPTTFFDDVTNQGEIRTSAGSFTVFFGSVSGAGNFTGIGTVNFEGDLKPGNSPADVQFAGDVVLGSNADLQIELGGTMPGSQYDRLTIAGNASLDGTLNVSLINGFTPTAGQQFTILTASSIVNNDLVLGGSAASAFTLLVNSTSVILQAIGLAGDYNHNGVVDAADYVAWRNGLGTTYTQNDYNIWRAHFAQTAGSGAIAGSAAVPEPITLVLLIFMGAGCCLTRGRMDRFSEQLINA